jgi:hypothetical protein
MDQRIYHGNIKPKDISRNLMAHFNKGNMRVQQYGKGGKLTVQIATIRQSRTGGQTALTIDIQTVEDGISINVGKQAWIGVAASLGFTALTALRNPITILHRLDDLAQDIESLQLTDEVWKVIDATARNLGTGHELSKRLKRLTCEHCGTANPVGEASCIACGAPLGTSQPNTCKKCGFVISSQEIVCPNCKQPI